MSVETPFDLADVCEAFIADRSISDDHLEYLRHAVEEGLTVFGGSPCIADGGTCSWLDLPPGSTWPECAATVLDAVEGTGNQWLNATRAHLELEVAA